MIYTVTWQRYPHGIEGEEMDCKWRNFDSFEKALKFLQGRHDYIMSINWAGGWIEDETGVCLYDITDCGEEEDHRKHDQEITLEQEETTQLVEETAENLQNVLETVTNSLANCFATIASILIPIFSEIAETYSLEEIQEIIRPPPDVSQQTITCYSLLWILKKF